MSVGVCYFPEHWPRERWPTDVDQMAAADFEYVRMGEFAWSRLEPDPGDLSLEWLVDAVDLVHDRGLAAVLCTPTATPPKWLVDAHPDILQAEADGTVREFGGRRHYCFNSPTYREETARIVTTLADRFADHPGVVGWQLDNEYGCHETVRCYCDDCARAFRDWLREQYGDVETLNEAWGTTFWSQHHTAFAEVDPPRHVTAEHHPSRLLDFARFASDSVRAYNALQADILRAANEEWFLTHNFMAGFADLNAHDLTESLDFAAWDSYPTGFAQFRTDVADRHLRAGDPDQVGLAHDLYRGESGFWVMEQQPGDINWAPHGPQPGAGAVALWAHHAIGHGAETVLYFRWRRCREGQEQYHAGLRKTDGSADRGYDEAARAAAELADVEPGPVDPAVAVLHDYENCWALEAQPHGTDFDYWAHLATYYRALRARGVTVDVVPPDVDLGGYAAVVAPTLHLATPALADALDAYVRSGGQLLVTMRSGVKTEANRLVKPPAPGPLRDLLGTTVDRHESLPMSAETVLEYDGERYPYRTWAEWLDPGDATAVAVHRSGPAAGRPAATRVTRGDGTAWYVGIWPSAGLADALVSTLLGRADVPTTGPLPDGIRLCQRGPLTWVTNFTGDPVGVRADVDAEWLLGDASMDPYTAAVIRAPAADIRVQRR